MSTPAGWYTDPDNPSGQRYWDGNAWTENRSGAPAAPATMTAAPNSHTTRNVLIAIGLVLLLLLGGCIALVAAGGKAVNDAIDEVEQQDAQPGGPDNPLEITEGDAFEVSGFNYAAGWSISKDAVGDLAVNGLKLTNNRDTADSAIVEIRFMDGNELVALADCTTPEIEPGQTVAVDCFSADGLPKSYDTVTINDTF